MLVVIVRRWRHGWELEVGGGAEFGVWSWSLDGAALLEFAPSSCVSQQKSLTHHSRPTLNAPTMALPPLSLCSSSSRDNTLIIEHLLYEGNCMPLLARSEKNVAHRWSSHSHPFSQRKNRSACHAAFRAHIFYLEKFQHQLLASTVSIISSPPTGLILLSSSSSIHHTHRHRLQTFAAADVT